MAKKKSKQKDKRKSEEIRWYKVLGVMPDSKAAHIIPMPDRGGAVKEASKLEQRGFSVVLLNFEGCVEYLSPWFNFELCKAVAAIDPAVAIRLSERYSSEVDQDESEVGEVRRVSVEARIFMDVVVKKGITQEEAVNETLDKWVAQDTLGIVLDHRIDAPDLVVYPQYGNNRDYFRYEEIAVHDIQRPRRK